MNASLARSAGARFRAAVAEERPLSVVGAINAYTARMAEHTGFKALYLSGGGVAANSLGMPDLGISTLDDVLTDVRRITDASSLPLLVDADTGWGGAFNIARTVRAMIKAGAGAMHIEDQVGTKRCGHRPGKEVVAREEMVDRIKAAVDARTDASFVIMARTDALAVEGLDRAIERAVAYVEAGADMIFPEAMTDLAMYRRFRAAVGVPMLANITEFGQTPLYTTAELATAGVDIVLHLLLGLPRDERGGAEGLRGHPPRRHAEERAAADADARRSVRASRLPRLRAKARPAVRRAQGCRLSANPMSTPMNDTILPKPKKSVALSGVTAGNTALCTVGRTGNDLHLPRLRHPRHRRDLRVRGDRLPARPRQAADARRARGYKRKLKSTARPSRRRCARRSSRSLRRRIRWT